MFQQFVFYVCPSLSFEGHTVCNHLRFFARAQNRIAYYRRGQYTHSVEHNNKKVMQNSFSVSSWLIGGSIESRDLGEKVMTCQKNKTKTENKKRLIPARKSAFAARRLYGIYVLYSFKQELDQPSRCCCVGWNVKP